MLPYTLGLTGCIGMGKSTVSKMFADVRVPVFCADKMNHKLRGPKGAALPVYEEFVPGSTDPETGANMDMIKEFVYADPKNLEALTLAIQPLMRDEIFKFRNSCFLQDHIDLVVLDIPLLFELELAELCDSVAVVTADEEVQRERVMARGTMTDDQFEKIKKAQFSDEKKRMFADWEIDTGCSLEETRSEVYALITKIRKSER